jgi:hypothetical protein
MIVAVLRRLGKNGAKTESGTQNGVGRLISYFDSGTKPWPVALFLVLCFLVSGFLLIRECFCYRLLVADILPRKLATRFSDISCGNSFLGFVFRCVRVLSPHAFSESPAEFRLGDRDRRPSDVE